jgi:hypothetical protein
MDTKIFQFYVLLIFNNVRAVSPISATFFKENTECNEIMSARCGDDNKNGFEAALKANISHFPLYVLSTSIREIQRRPTEVRS